MSNPMNRTTNTTKYTELSKETQAQIADRVIGMLMNRVWKDETTDFSGFTISKRRLGEHAAKVQKDIERGALQPTTIVGKIT